MIAPVDPVLRLSNVSVRYPSASLPALHDCSLEVQPGEHVALLGLNGSGKTTLMMAIAGLVKTTGEICVGGVILRQATLRDVRNRIGLLFATPEDQLLFPRVVDDVAYGLLRRGRGSAEAYVQAQQELDLLEVGDLAEREPYELSHGQRLRVALAGVLVVKPQLLLLDEATASLDPPGRKALTRLLRDTPSAFLLATHDLDAAERSCGRFLVLDRGRIVADTHALQDVRSMIERDAS